MKKITYLTFALAIVVLTSCSSDKKESTEANATEAVDSAPVLAGKYKIKSGTMHFESTAGSLKLRKIVYFDDFGAKERVESYDADGSLKGYNTSDGKKRYYVDLQNKTAWVTDNLGNRGWEMEFLSWDAIERNGNEKQEFKRVDNITVAGKDCEAYEFRGMTVFAGWHGLTLYQKQKPNILVQAVKLEENVDHDDALFAVPAGFELKERPM